jgi:alkanesulfonate monooxygenase SsuD/methylene tetrahydromethanopterin reductase-like flavin-dependent oxidoreductase (luciferase family)
MKFFLGGLGNLYANVETITGAVIEADRLGFQGALMPDHYMWGEMRGHRMPNAYSTLETWVTLTYLAGKTEKISLGTLITPLPFRPPAMLAKMLSTLDVEGLKLMVELWTKDVVDFKGKFYEAKSAVLEPKPVQKPYPRLLFGSQGDRMLRLTGRYANICFIPPWSGDQHGAIKAKVLDAAEKAGRAGEVEFMTGDMGGRGPYDAGELSKKIEAAEESGAGIYMASFPREEMLGSMRRFADDVMPSYA